MNLVVVTNDGKLCISTGMFDKNRAEIVDVNVLIDKQGNKWKVFYNGITWWIGLITTYTKPFYQECISTLILLTPDIAGELEVVGD